MRVERPAHSDRRASWLCALPVMLACATSSAGAVPPSPTGPDWTDAATASRMLVVAIVDKPEPASASGATPRGYAGMPDYSGSERGRRASARIAREYGLREVSAWTIEPLRLRCVVLELPPGLDRGDLLARLGHDRRIRLAQPLQEFETLALASTAPTHSATADNLAHYNDPYFTLQHNLQAIGGEAAQRWTHGDGVRIAVIDAGVDSAHPDLSERIARQRDFVDAEARAVVAEKHGTEVAGAIAAVANNHLGIVGVAPGARLYAYRACWSTPGAGGRARCNSYTLALALGAAIAADVRIINLSLGGPPDALLAQLVAHAVERGIVVVGALPPDGRTDGFPLAVPGVVAVGMDADAVGIGPGLVAPGRDILTLQPGGGFDYVSGSSLAAAQISGAFALLLSLKPRLDRAELTGLLTRTRNADGVINACRAVAELRQRAETCTATRR